MGARHLEQVKVGVETLAHAFERHQGPYHEGEVAGNAEGIGVERTRNGRIEFGKGQLGQFLPLYCARIPWAASWKAAGS